MNGKKGGIPWLFLLTLLIGGLSVLMFGTDGGVLVLVILLILFLVAIVF